jgi:hypothetical protein
MALKAGSHGLRPPKRLIERMLHGGSLRVYEYDEKAYMGADEWRRAFEPLALLGLSAPARPEPMCGLVIRVDLVRLQVEEEVVHEVLLEPAVLVSHCVARGNAGTTYCAFVNTTAMLSDVQRSRFGAMTSARLTGVIFVAACVFSSRKSWRKLTTNRTTRR